MSSSKKKDFKVFKIGLISLGVFLLASVFLLSSTKAVDLAESKIIFSSNSTKVFSVVNSNEIAGIEKKPQIEIVDSKIPSPKFTATAVLATDISSGDILFQKNIHQRLAPASTTKIMTAIVASEYYKSGDILYIPQTAMVGGSSMGLTAGESLTFRSLLYGMLLNSGNDAAYTLALDYPGGLEAFVGAMNKKASDLGLQDTHFQNPAGFDSDNHYSSAYDLSQIAQEAIKNPIISKIVSTKETQVSSFDKTKVHPLKNLNKLLALSGVIGIKTGTTEKAGESLVALVQRDKHEILTVMLNSEDRFDETKSLIDWVYNNFSWKQNF